MNLFEIGEDSVVSLNKVWISMIPEFKKLLDRDKGSAGDYRGAKKLQARKEFTYIYFYADFKSPIRDYEESERHKEALYYANLESVDEPVLTARKKYNALIMKGTRSLRTYKALLQTLDALDLYFETLDFQLLDRNKQLINNPDTVGKTIERMDKIYISVRNFERRVEEEMKAGSAGIRGVAELGDNEATDGSLMTRKKEWSELDIQEGSVHAQEKVLEKPKATTTFGDIMHAIQSQSKTAKVTAEELEAYQEEPEK